jgi:hypothetical protein
LEQDTSKYDSLEIRPLPKWLTDQKARNMLTEEKEQFIREDNSLNIALGLTLLSTLLFVLLFTYWIIRRKKIKE